MKQERGMYPSLKTGFHWASKKKCIHDQLRVEGDTFNSFFSFILCRGQARRHRGHSRALRLPALSSVRTARWKTRTAATSANVCQSRPVCRGQLRQRGYCLKTDFSLEIFNRNAKNNLSFSVIFFTRTTDYADNASLSQQTMRDSLRVWLGGGQEWLHSV